MTDPYEELAAMRARLAELERFAAGHPGMDGLIRRAAGRAAATAAEPSPSTGSDFDDDVRRLAGHPEGRG